MSQQTGGRLANALYGLMSGLDATDRELIKRFFDSKFKVRVPLTDSGASATAAPAQTFFTNDLGATLRVTAAKLLSPVTIAPGATHNVTFTVDKVDADGSNSATIATYTSDVAGGTATADKPKELTVTGGTSTVAAVASGWSLRAACSKGASGNLISDGTAPSWIEVTLDWDV